MEGSVFAVFSFLQFHEGDLQGRQHISSFSIFEVAPYWSFLVGSSSWCSNMGHLPSVLTGMSGKKWTVGKIGGSRLTCFISPLPGRKPFLGVSWHLPSTPTDFSCDLTVIQLRGHSFDFGLH